MKPYPNGDKSVGLSMRMARLCAQMFLIRIAVVELPVAFGDGIGGGRVTKKHIC